MQARIDLVYQGIWRSSAQGGVTRQRKTIDLRSRYRADTRRPRGFPLSAFRPLGQGIRQCRHASLSAMNSNTLVGLVLKNPEIHAQPPLSSPCQNDANRNKSDRPHATAKSSDTVMASSVKPPFQSDQWHRTAPHVRSSFIGEVGYGRSRRCRG